MTLEIEAKRNYVMQLKRALDLILNDLPDHQDDTIISKSIDSVKDQLIIEFNNSLCTSDSSVNATLKEFLLKQIVESKDYILTLSEKDHDIVQFFFNITAVYIQVYGTVDADFIDKTLQFLNLYFKSYLETQFITYPTICCSVLNLLTILYDQVNLCASTNVQKESIQFFNNTVIDQHMFGQKSLQQMLQINCKSIFVRKSYKQLLHKHMIYLIGQKLNNPSIHIDQRLEALITSLSRDMPLETRMHNVDIISDIIENFLQASDSNNLRNLGYLCMFYSKFDFASVELSCLLNCEHLINDASIESLTIVIGFGLFCKLFDAQKILDQNFLGK